jgi:chorismate mutase / prephenate dehydratase
MAEAEPTLAQLRGEIDAIDDQLLGLLMRRAEVALAIGAAKNAHDPKGPAMRPGREALVLRRLLAGRDGPFPKAVIVRLWREMMGAVLRLQGPFSVAVYAPPGQPGYWDLARDHFGSLTPASAHDTTQQVVNAVGGGRASVGVLPIPDGEDPQPWWPMMLAKDTAHPRIVAKLPFSVGDTVRGAPLEAFAVAPCESEPTGHDRSLLVVEASDQISRSSVLAEGRSVGLEAGTIQSWQPPGETQSWLHLIDVEGFLSGDDPRLAGFAARLGKALGRIWPVGGYALPLSAAELGLGGKG